MRLACVIATGYVLLCFEVVPQSPEILTKTACYGTTHSSFVTLTCGVSEVIVVRSVKAMAKRNETLCPDTQIATNEEFTKSRNCCIHEPADCGGRYTGQVYKSYYQNCQGKRQCAGLQASWVVTNEEFPHCDPSLYIARTNYMIYEYSCVSTQSIRSPCAGLQATGTSVYLWNSGYPAAMQPSGADSCNCSVEILCDSSIVVTAIDLRLQSSSNVCKQTITISDSTVDKQIDCSLNNDFVTTTVMTSEAYLMTLQFKDDYQQTGGNFWIEISGGHPSAELSLKCGDSLTTGLTDTQKPVCGTDATASTTTGADIPTTQDPASVTSSSGTTDMTGGVTTTQDSASVTTSSEMSSTTESTSLSASVPATADTTSSTSSTDSTDITGSILSSTSDTTTNVDSQGNSSFSTNTPTSITISSDSSTSEDNNLFSSSTPTTASFTDINDTTDGTGSITSIFTTQDTVDVTKATTGDSLHSMTTAQSLINVTNGNGNIDSTGDSSTTTQTLISVTSNNGNTVSNDDRSSTTQSVINITSSNGNTHIRGSSHRTGITTDPNGEIGTDKNGNRDGMGIGGDGNRGSNGTGSSDSEGALKIDNSTEDSQSDNSLMVVIIALAVVAVVVILVILILFINRKKIRQAFCPSKVDEASLASDRSSPPLYDSMPNPLFSAGALPVIPGTAAGSTQLQMLPGGGFVGRKPQLAPLFPPVTTSPRHADSHNQMTSLLFDGHLPPIGSTPRSHETHVEVKPERTSEMSPLPPIDTSTTPRPKPRLSLLSMIMEENARDSLPRNEAMAEDTSARRDQRQLDMEAERKSEKKRRLRKKKKKLLERLHNVKHI